MFYSSYGGSEWDENQYRVRNNQLNITVTKILGNSIPVPSQWLSSPPADAGVCQAGNSPEMLLQGPQSSASYPSTWQQQLMPPAMHVKGSLKNAIKQEKQLFGNILYMIYIVARNKHK